MGTPSFPWQRSFRNNQIFATVNKAHDGLRNRIVKAINIKAKDAFENMKNDGMLKFEEAIELDEMLKKLPKEES